MCWGMGSRGMHVRRRPCGGRWWIGNMAVCVCFLGGGGVVGGWGPGPLTSSEVCMGLASGRI